MIPIHEAFQIIDRQTQPLAAENVGIDAAAGRVLAEDVRADSDLPPFDRSQMDGYAVRADDTADVPVKLKLVGESAAGSGWNGELGPGEAVRIMTGARLPNGADAVQKVELTRETGDSVEILEPTKRGRFLVARGQEVKDGDTVLEAGTRLTPKMVAPLASFGYRNVSVSRRPRLNILATGSEIVEIAEKPGRDQIRNSNSSMLLALAAGFYETAASMPIARDNITDLESGISKAAANADVLVMTGGVSVGKYDLTKDVLRGLGAEIFFERVRLKPGKPTVFARLNDCLVFGLPGNPVSAAVSFYLFVRRAMLRMQNAAAVDLRRETAVCGGTVKGTKERDSYLPVILSTDSDGSLIAEPLRWHGSSDFIAFSLAEALVHVPPETRFEQGDTADIYRID